jgi:hypothetical protein
MDAIEVAADRISAFTPRVPGFADVLAVLRDMASDGWTFTPPPEPEPEVSLLVPIMRGDVEDVIAGRLDDAGLDRITAACRASLPRTVTIELDVEVRDRITERGERGVHDAASFIVAACAESLEAELDGTE